MDSKWRFCLRLKRFYRTCFIADGRVSAQYERGWNDAVASLMASIGTLYRRQEPFLKTLLENSLRAEITAERQASVRVVAGGLEFRNHIAGLLPETWYADLPVENRIQLLAEQWQRLQRICEAQLTRIAELEAERSVLRQQFHSEAEQRQFLGDLIDNMPHAQIAAELTEFKAEVAAALEELRLEMELSAGQLRETEHWETRLGAVIASMNLPSATPKISRRDDVLAAVAEMQATMTDQAKIDLHNATIGLESERLGLAPGKDRQ